MWRAFFLAVGIMLAIVGVECLLVERVVLAASEEPAAMNGFNAAQKQIEPAEWAPWGFISAGAVVILYSFSIPRRVNGG